MLSPERYLEFWPLIEKELDLVPHIWQRWWTKEWLKMAPVNGLVNVWAFGDEAEVNVVVFTQYVTMPTGTIFRAFLALGNSIEKCLPQITAQFQKVARDMGCIEAEIIGRPGWERIVPGFKRSAVILSMPLQHFEVH